jgi:MscS family membrane protein
MNAPERLRPVVLALCVVLACALFAAPPLRAAEPTATEQQVADEVEVTETGGEGAPNEPAGQGEEETVSGNRDADPLIDLSKEAEEHLGTWTTREIIGGIEVWEVLAAFAFILLGLVAKKVSDYVMAHKIVPLLEKTPFEFDNLVAEAAAKPFGWLLALGGLAGAVAVMRLPVDPPVRGFVYGTLKVLLVADVIWFLFRAVDVVVHYLTKAAERTDSKLDDQIVPLIRKALKATIGVFSTVWVIQMLGYNVSSLIAGLGIGGLAVALALQDTLGNFFGSIFIFLDRPFALGDWIKIGDTEGIVEGIGYRSTRIRTWPKSVVSMPNKYVAETTIENWSRMPVRRVFQTVGVTYETTADQMQDAVAAIRGILESDEGVDQEFMVVRFGDFGDSSLDITVYYFTTGVAYADHMETKERVNLAIMRALEERGLSIAFPTRTVYFEGDVAKEMLPEGRGSGDGAGESGE